MAKQTECHASEVIGHSKMTACPSQKLSFANMSAPVIRRYRSWMILGSMIFYTLLLASYNQNTLYKAYFVATNWNFMEETNLIVFETQNRTDLHIFGHDGHFSRRYNLNISVYPKNMFGNPHVIRHLDKIPKIIHQTAEDENLPVAVKKWMQSWLRHNPDWQYWFWTDADIRYFIATRYPKFLSSYNSYVYNIQRADVFRYFLMYEFGGLYADTDIECLRPLDIKVEEHSCILSQEPPEHAQFMYDGIDRMVSNALIACRPGHLFYKYVLEHLVEKYTNNPGNIVRSTGPIMLDEDYAEYIKIARKTDIPFLEKPEVYQNKFDERKINVFKIRCKIDRMTKKKAKLCEKLLSPEMKNGPTQESYTIHHWTHSYETGKHNFDPYGLNLQKGTFSIERLWHIR